MKNENDYVSLLWPLPLHLFGDGEGAMTARIITLTAFIAGTCAGIAMTHGYIYHKSRAEASAGRAPYPAHTEHATNYWIKTPRKIEPTIYFSDDITEYVFIEYLEDRIVARSSRGEEISVPRK